MRLTTGRKQFRRGQGCPKLITRVMVLSIASLATSWPLRAIGDPQRQPSAAEQKKAGSQKLTLKKIEQLVAVMPDAALGKEIAARGLSETYSREFVERIRKLGGGPETIGTLERLLPRAILQLQSEADAEVFLDGVRVASVTSTGQVMVAKIDPGMHQLSVRKPKRLPYEQLVDLAAHRITTVQAPLAWTVGFLSADTGMDEARIEVLGAGVFRRRIEKLELPVGSYQLTASAPRHLPTTLTVQIEGGQTSSIPIELATDKRAMQGMRTQLRQAYEAGRYQEVIRAAMALSESPQFTPADLRMAADAYWQLRDFRTFVPVAKDVLAAGETLTFTLTHHHQSVFEPHTMRVTVTASTIQLEPIGSCTLETSEVWLTSFRPVLRQLSDDRYANQKALGLDFQRGGSVHFVDADQARLEALYQLLVSLRRGS